LNGDEGIIEGNSNPGPGKKGDGANSDNTKKVNRRAGG